VARFSHGEMRDALALIDAGHSAGRSAAAFADSVVDGLARLVTGAIVGYNEREIDSHRLLTASEVPRSSPSQDVSEAVAAFCGEYPLSIQRRSAETRALKISDFVSARQLHRLDYYDHALRPLGVEYQLRLWLAAPAGQARYFYISRQRRDGDFGEHERDLLELLRPFLVALRERIELPLPVELTVDGLTEREAEILAWVARGKTNDEIAALLVVSPHTVRKHLENVYQKLRVHSRTAAVARAFAPFN
jgi:DNA-binding CsgD family transcriptional regulator